MHIGMRSRFATSKILKALLLGVVPIALAIPAGEVAFSQSATWSVARGPLFTAIDLNPSGFVESWATGASEGRQVGYGYGPATGGYGHALLWHGTAASAVDLHPSGFMISRILGISGAQQVGYGYGRATRGGHALLWRGTTNSVVDLNPPGFIQSQGSAPPARNRWGLGLVRPPSITTMRSCGTAASTARWTSTGATGCLPIHRLSPPPAGSRWGSELIRAGTNLMRCCGTAAPTA